ncbi:hypothetical protein [Bacillus sp. 1P02SD]|uniref:hypothetical protein n=1 Tax=Bacillus sp. 1P02SD TaxID=3132264 RepID=UPI00399F9FED
MNKNKDRKLYLNMILGSIGIIFITLGIFEFLTIVESTVAYILTILGFVITVHYIYHLEKKAGISDKIIWIRAFILIIIVVSIYNIFY